MNYTVDSPDDVAKRIIIVDLYRDIRLQRMDTPDLSNDAYYSAWLLIMGLNETLEIYDDR